MSRADTPSSFPDPESAGPDELSWSVLDGYFSGTCTASVRAAVEQWAGQGQAQADELARLRRVWGAAAQVTSRFDAEAAWAIVRPRTDAQRGRDATDLRRANGPVVRDAPIVRTTWYRRVGVAVGVAAAIVVAVIGGVLPRTGHVLPSIVYRTRVAERATVALPDGSRVTLAPQTTLTVGAGFGGRHRVVSLTGEAVFTVTPESGTPFIVRTGAVETRVLGTSFDVHHYATDRTVRVVVTQGKVAISGATRSRVTTLTAGMLAFATDSTISTATMGDATPYTGWTANQLKFANAPLPDVLATVGRWYGYRFQLADTSLAGDHVTATFDYASTTDMIKALEALLAVSATFETHGTDTVVMLRRRTRVSTPDSPRHVFPSTFSPRTEVGR